MLQLRVSENWLDLYKDAKISFELNNPAFQSSSNSNLIPGSFSFNFRVPATGNNNTILKQLNLLDNDLIALKNLACEVYVQGRRLFTGKLEVKTATEKDYEVFFVTTTLVDFKDELLNSYDLGTVVMGADAPSALAYENDTVANPLNYDAIFFPVLNYSYFTKDNNFVAEIDNIQNYWLRASHSFATHAVMMPFIRLFSLLEKLFALKNIDFTNLFQRNDELKQICIYNNYSIYRSENDWHLKYNTKDHLPAVKTADFLRYVCRLFNLSFIRQPFSDKIVLVANNDIFITNELRDWTDKLLFGYELSYEDAKIPTYFVFNDQFLTERIEKPTTVGTYNSFSEMHTDWINSLITDTGYYYLKDADAYARVTGDAQSGSLLMPTYAEDKTGTEADNTLTITAGGAPVGIEQFVYTNEAQRKITQLMPLANVEGDMEARNVKNKKYPLYFTIFRGIDASEGIPFASSHVFNSYGVQVGDYSLFWDTEFGLYEKWYKTWTETIAQARYLKVRFLLTINDLANFSFMQKIRIKNRNYIVKQLKIELYDAEKVVSEAILLNI